MARCSAQVVVGEGWQGKQRGRIGRPAQSAPAVGLTIGFVAKRRSGLAPAEHACVQMHSRAAQRQAAGCDRPVRAGRESATGLLRTASGR